MPFSSVYDKGYKYCEVLFGDFKNRSNPTVKELAQSNLLADWYGHDVTDAFTSAFMFREDYKQYAEAEGTIRGYSGTVAVDFLYWDFDSDNLLRAYTDATALTERLIDKGIHWGNIFKFFSGNKGFHVVAYLSTLQQYAGNEQLPAIVKSVCCKLAEGLPTFDSAIYNKDRLFRTCNSKHSKTGLYKVPLNELGSYSDLLVYAKQQHKLDVSNVSEDEADGITALINYAVNLDNPSSRVSVNAKSGSLSGLQFGLAKGSRNATLASLAGLLRSRNVPTDLIRSLCHATNAQSEEPLPEREVDTVVTSVSRYPVRPECADILDKDILTMGEALTKYKQIRSRTDKIQYCYPHMNELLPFFLPGETLLIAGRSAVGKTTFSMPFLNSLAEFLGGVGVFFSLEMPSHSVALRSACMTANKYSDEELNTNAVDGMLMYDNDNQFFNQVCHEWGSTIIVDKDRMSPEQIEQTFFRIKEKHENIPAILIDYGQLMAGADDVEGASVVAKSMKGLSKRLDTRVIIVLQITRAGEDGHVPVKLQYLKGSGSWEEVGDYVFGGYKDKKDNSRSHWEALKDRWIKDSASNRFDVINKGLYYRSEDYKEDKDSW